MARKKPLTIVEPVSFETTSASINFEKPDAKGAVKLIDPNNISELINLLHNEAKVI